VTAPIDEGEETDTDDSDTRGEVSGDEIAVAATKDDESGVGNGEYDKFVAAVVAGARPTPVGAAKIVAGTAGCAAGLWRCC